MHQQTQIESGSVAHRVKEVAQLARVGRTLIYDEIKHGRLVARKVGRRTVILRSDLEAWLNTLPTS
jgi:excisionase family DNA binding protein